MSRIFETIGFAMHTKLRMDPEARGVLMA